MCWLCNFFFFITQPFWEIIVCYPIPCDRIMFLMVPGQGHQKPWACNLLIFVHSKWICISFFFCSRSLNIKATHDSHVSSSKIMIWMNWFSAMQLYYYKNRWIIGFIYENDILLTSHENMVNLLRVKNYAFIKSLRRCLSIAGQWPSYLLFWDELFTTLMRFFHSGTFFVISTSLGIRRMWEFQLLNCMLIHHWSNVAEINW